MSLLRENIKATADKLVNELEAYMSTYSEYECKSQKDALKVVKLLRLALDSEDIDIRILRAFKDISTDTAINFEDESYAVFVFEIKELLGKEYPGLKNLPLLGADFGKGDPI